MNGLREAIMAQCNGTLVPFNLPAANASQQMLPGSTNRVGIAIPPSSIVAAFNTRKLTSATDGISPQTGWSQMILIDLWSYGRLCQAPWFCWALMPGTGYVIEIEYAGRIDLATLADQIAGGAAI